MKLFGTDGIRGKYGEYPITENIAHAAGIAAVRVFGKGQIILGQDTRKSGESLSQAFAAGVEKEGGVVKYAGVIPTPAVSFLTRKHKTQAGVMISASHNPFTDNGIKFFNNTGRKINLQQEKQLEKIIREHQSDEHVVSEIKAQEEMQAEYISFCISHFEKDALKDLSLVIDCAHGAAVPVAENIFRKMGAEVHIINASPDGVNINEQSGALHPERLAETVLDKQADIGIAFDGDADRVVVVDEKGTIFTGDDILGLLAQNMIKEKRLNDNAVVVTHYSNLALDEYLRELGGKVVRVDNGDKYVSAEMEASKYNLGGEDSGHIILSGMNPTGDGIIAGLAVASVLAEKKAPLSSLNALQKNPQVLISVPVLEKKPFEEMDQLQKMLANYRAELEKTGRIFLRYSGTEMKARIMIEGKDKKRIIEIAEHIQNEIQKNIGVSK